jgi:hypothetical protein
MFVVLFSERKLKLFFETCDQDSSGALSPSEIGEVIKVGWRGYTHLERMCAWVCACAWVCTSIHTSVCECGPSHALQTPLKVQLATPQCMPKKLTHTCPLLPQAACTDNRLALDEKTVKQLALAMVAEVSADKEGRAGLNGRV